MTSQATEIQTHMDTIDYVNLGEFDSNEFMQLLNKHKVREHLIEHPLFDENTTKEWLHSKIKVDSSQGSKVRAIVINKKLAGWCGIQLEGDKHEIAIVLDDDYWGQGRNIYREIMSWAKELGHKTIYIHLLYTRPKYKFLQKISNDIYKSERLGSKFTTYELAVE